ncbi:hypothetical protein M885DRAFT_542329 [Pelagophyceae sp. CCMP2097]|nr:hypothetical protein M885DRAFT_542329 [Pelagophyceae sp. CCMP2097]
MWFHPRPPTQSACHMAHAPGRRGPRPKGRSVLARASWPNSKCQLPASRRPRRLETAP